MSSENFTKENLDTYLKELAKEFRRINGKSMPAEIVLVGGAAILTNYGFRDMTTDIDAVIHGEDMKLQIKEFAVLTGVSVRTLHYYDEIGLLKSSFVDEQNGYRFYDRIKTDEPRTLDFSGVRGFLVTNVCIVQRSAA